MMDSNKVAILTDFLNYDEGYSLCRVVQNQCKMLRPKLIVRKGFDHKHDHRYNASEIIEVDPGEIGNNVVNVNDISNKDIISLTRQLEIALEDIDIVLTHDLLFQPNQWKYNIAAKRIEKKWIHWVHSSSAPRIGVGKFQEEFNEKFKRSKLVAFHPEEILRKSQLYGYDRNDIIVVPNPIDLTEDYHPIAKEVIKTNELWDKDIIAVYPARLDRGKQPHIIAEIFSQLKKLSYNVKVIIVDFHSVDGDKDTYRKQMKDAFGDLIYFTSDIEKYTIPHKAVMDLIEYSDIFIHPSRSEGDPLILSEAAWKKCGLILNFDLPAFRQYAEYAGLFKFSSNVDIATGMPGETQVSYSNRKNYMHNVANYIINQMTTNSVLKFHSEIRKTRSVEVIGRTLNAICSSI